MLTVLNVTAMLVSGLLAGVFFDVAIAMMPAFFAMRPGSYIEANNMIGEHYHPIMPIVVNIATISDLLLGILSDSAAHKALFFVAFASLVGVQLVSQFGNVPINKRMLAIDPENVPDDWGDPRRLWSNWHFLRTAFAGIAFVINGTAVVLAAV
ncbi:MAG: anthrone oxygenase family protein [Labedaea sp.]